jgi:hypothetical protein
VARAGRNGCSDADADDEPFCSTSRARPETSSAGGAEGGVALVGKRVDLHAIVGGLLLGFGKFALTSTTILDKIKERLQVFHRELGDGFGRAWFRFFREGTSLLWVAAG